MAGLFDLSALFDPQQQDANSAPPIDPNGAQGNGLGGLGGLNTLFAPEGSYANSLSPDALKALAKKGDDMRSQSLMDLLPNKNAPMSWSNGLDYALRQIRGNMLSNVGGLEEGRRNTLQNKATESGIEGLNPSMNSRSASASGNSSGNSAAGGQPSAYTPGGPSQTGSVDQRVGREIASLMESNGGKNTYNPLGYRGELQYLPGAGEAKYGINDSNFRDHPTQFKAYDAEAADNVPYFQKHVGRPPTDAEVYMMHQQGLGGTVNHASNPEGSAVDNMANTGEGRQKGHNWAFKAVSGNMTPDMKANFNPNTITSGQLLGAWTDRYNSLSTRAADLALQRGEISQDEYKQYIAGRNANTGAPNPAQVGLGAQQQPQAGAQIPPALQQAMLQQAAGQQPVPQQAMAQQAGQQPTAQQVAQQTMGQQAGQQPMPQQSGIDAGAQQAMAQQAMAQQPMIPQGMAQGMAQQPGAGASAYRPLPGTVATLPNGQQLLTKAPMSYDPQMLRQLAASGADPHILEAISQRLQEQTTPKETQVGSSNITTAAGGNAAGASAPTVYQRPGAMAVNGDNTGGVANGTIVAPGNVGGATVKDRIANAAGIAAAGPAAETGVQNDQDQVNKLVSQDVQTGANSEKILGMTKQARDMFNTPEYKRIILGDGNATAQDFRYLAHNMGVDPSRIPGLDKLSGQDMVNQETAKTITDSVNSQVNSQLAALMGGSAPDMKIVDPTQSAEGNLRALNNFEQQVNQSKALGQYSADYSKSSGAHSMSDYKAGRDKVLQDTSPKFDKTVGKQESPEGRIVTNQAGEKQIKKNGKWEPYNG